MIMGFQKVVLGGTWAGSGFFILQFLKVVSEHDSELVMMFESLFDKCNQYRMYM